MNVEEIFSRSAKTWKEKIENLEIILKMQQDNQKNDFFDKNIDNLNILLSEKNINVLDKSLEVILSYLSLPLTNCKKFHLDCSKNLIDKCFNLSKQSIRENSVNILLKIAETYTSEVIELLLTILKSSSKKPVIVNTCLEAITKIVKIYNKIPVERITEVVIKFIESRDKNNRDLTKSLILEIGHIFGRSVVEKHFNGLKGSLAQELISELNKINDREPDLELVKTKRELNDIVEKKVDALLEKEMDATEPFNLLSVLPADMNIKLDGSRDEKKEVLESLRSLTAVPYIKQGNYRELVRRMCDTLSKDSQITNVLLASEILYNLSVGMHKNFSKYAVLVVVSCLDKFKDKKVVEGIKKCIDSAFLWTSLDSCISSILEALENKNPTIKYETVDFLLRISDVNKWRDISKKNLIHLLGILAKLCNDSAPDVREKTFKLFGWMKKIFDEKYINSVCEGLDVNKRKKIELYSLHMDNLESKNKLTGLGTTKMDNDESSMLGESCSSVNLENSRIKKPRNANLQKQRVKQIFVSNSNLNENNENIIKNEEQFKKLSSNNWKERLECFDALLCYVDRNECDQNSCLKFLKLVLTKPGLKEHNISILKKRLEILQVLYCKKNVELTSQMIELFIPGVLDKIGDIKLGSSVLTLMTLLCNKANDKTFFLLKVFQLVTEVKVVKCVIDTLDWLYDYLWNCEIKKIILFKDVLGQIKVLLASPNHTIRQKTIKLIGALYKNIGKIPKFAFDTEKIAIVDSIQEEIQKVSNIIKEESSKYFVQNENFTNETTVFVEKQNLTTLVEKEIMENNEYKMNEISAENLYLPNIVQGAKCLEDTVQNLKSARSTMLDDRRYESIDDARSFILDISQKLSTAIEKHTEEIFKCDLKDILTNVKSMGDDKMQNCFTLLYTTLNEVWVRKETVETQTKENMLIEEIDKENEQPFSVDFVSRGRNRSKKAKILSEQKYNKIYSLKEMIDIIDNTSYFTEKAADKLTEILESSDYNELLLEYVPQLYDSLTNVIVRTLTSVKDLSNYNGQEIANVFDVLINCFSQSKVGALCDFTKLLRLLECTYILVSEPKFEKNKKVLSDVITKMTGTVPIMRLLYCQITLLYNILEGKSHKTEMYAEIVVKCSCRFLKLFKEKPVDIDSDVTSILTIINEAFNKYLADPNVNCTYNFKYFKTMLVALINKFGFNIIQQIPVKNNNTLLKRYMYARAEKGLTVNK